MILNVMGRIDPSDYQDIYDAYLNGETQKQIADRYAVSRNTIGRVLDKLGLKDRTYRRGSRRNIELETSIISMYKFGLSRTEISNKLDISFYLVTRILTDNGINITNRSKGEAHHQVKKAKAAALERKYLYEQGYTCAEIGRILGDSKDRCLRLLRTYYPEILISEKGQLERRERILKQAANKELMRGDHILSNRFK
jgi:DNA-binding CsgD family transcriptional regulator